LDDRTGRDHDCDFLLDAAATDARVYAGRVPEKTRILAGPGFALMRQSFVARREAALARRDGRAVEDILISFGAADPMNVIPATLDAVSQTAGIRLTVAMSSAGLHIADVRRRLNGRTRLIVDTTDMAGLMTEADMAIGAAGVTAFERAALGLPSILVTLANNQRGIARLMVEAGAALDGGEPGANFAARLPGLVATLLNDSSARKRMTRAASSLVDGRGAARIVEIVS
jgi:spore coat polysaccharide biosynthesis predicted glycosyltransferase SpsG